MIDIEKKSIDLVALKEKLGRRSESIAWTLPRFDVINSLVTFIISSYNKNI